LIIKDFVNKLGNVVAVFFFTVVNDFILFSSFLNKFFGSSLIGSSSFLTCGIIDFGSTGKGFRGVDSSPLIS